MRNVRPILRVHRAARASVLVAAALALLLQPAGVLTAVATGGPSVTAPSTQTFAVGGEVVDPGDFVLAGFSTDVLVSVTVSGGDGPSLSIPSASRGSLALASGITVWEDSAELGFRGTMADANTALAAMTLDAGGTAGDVTVAVEAVPDRDGITYDPVSGSFYEFVASNGISWTAAKDAAAARPTFLGRAGHLVTITSQAEEDFVQGRIQNAQDVWIGASDADAEGVWKWVVGPEAGTQFWSGDEDGSPVGGLYNNWCVGSEPNDSSNEDYAVTLWGGGDCWNDLNNSGGARADGYVAEYSDPGDGSGVSSASVTHTFSAVVAASASAGNAQARVSWTTAATVTGVSVTASPGGETCTATDATSCVVTGLDNGTAYSFAVTVTESGGATATRTTESVTPVSSAPGLTGPTTASGGAGSAVTLGSFTITDPASCGWEEVIATATTDSGTLTADDAGGATVTGSGSTSVVMTGSRAQVAAALATLALTDETAGTATVSTEVVPAVRFTVGDDTWHFNPDNGHYYTATAHTGFADRAAAIAAVQADDFCGSAGYLATIVDADEQSFLESEALTVAEGDLWLGAERVGTTCSGSGIGSCTGGTWRWTPGQSAPDGDADLALYDVDGGGPWQANEPNGSGPYLQFWFTGGRYGWDDVTDGERDALAEYGSTTSFVAPSVTTTVTIAAVAPGAPPVTLGSPSDTTIPVSWSAPSDTGGSVVTGYVLAYSIDDGATWIEVLNGSTLATSTTLTGLAAETSYRVRVAAVTIAGTGPYATASISTAATPVSDPRPVTDPDGDLPDDLPGGASGSVDGEPVPPMSSSPVPGTAEYRVGQVVARLDLAVAGAGTVDTGSGGQQVLRVTSGGVGTLEGTGMRPGTIAEVWLPLPEGTSRRVALLPIGDDGTFDGALPFTGELDALGPLPVGDRTLQIYGLDESGLLTVMNLGVRIEQPGPRAPEPERGTGQPPTPALGSAVATRAGIPVDVTVTPDPETRSTRITGDGWLMDVDVPEGIVRGEAGLPLLEVVAGDDAEVRGTGFMPGTRAYVWLMSDATFLGEVTVGTDGTFRGGVPIEGVAPGTHTLQLSGVGTDGYVRAANLSVMVLGDGLPRPSRVNAGGGPMPVVPPMSILWGAVLMGAVVVAQQVRTQAWWAATVEHRDRLVARQVALPAFDELDERLRNLLERLR